MKQYLISYVKMVVTDISRITGNAIRRSEGIYNIIIEGNSPKEVYETFKKENAGSEIIAISYIGD